MENKDKKLMVLFPGRGYTVSSPLLYYAHFKYERMGYEILRINYGDFNTFDEAKNNALGQVQELNFAKYDNVVFISKSMGTVIAGWIVEKIKHKYNACVLNSD